MILGRTDRPQKHGQYFTDSYGVENLITARWLRVCRELYAERAHKARIKARIHKAMGEKFGNEVIKAIRTISVASDLDYEDNKLPELYDAVIALRGLEC